MAGGPRIFWVYLSSGSLSPPTPLLQCHLCEGCLLFVSPHPKTSSLIRHKFLSSPTQVRLYLRKTLFWLLWLHLSPTGEQWSLRAEWGCSSSCNGWDYVNGIARRPQAMGRPVSGEPSTAVWKGLEVIVGRFLEERALHWRKSRHSACLLYPGSPQAQGSPGHCVLPADAVCGSLRAGLC